MVRDLARTLLRGTRAAIRRPANRLANQIDPPLVILLYHRVTALARDPERLAVAPERFRAHLKHLKARHPVVRLGEPWALRRESSVAITFDDGYADNAVEALPILEEVGIPATFFVTTGPVVTGREFWWDELDRATLGAGALPDRFDFPGDPKRRAWLTRTREERERLYRDLHAWAKRAAPEPRESLLAALGRWARIDPAPRPEHRPMTIDEVRRLGASAVADVGAHGVTHTAMAALSLADQRAEMVASKECLEAWLGRDVRTFSFPFGGSRDFEPASVTLARAVGFRRAAANRPGQVHRWTNGHALPRFIVRDWEPEQFARELQRFFVA